MGSNLFEEYNNVKLQGRIISDKILNHEIFGEKFYKFELEVPRLSDAVDIIPILVSERLLVNDEMKLNTYIYVEGQYRSYNDQNDSKHRLVLMVFAKSYNKIKGIDLTMSQNEILLNGFLCKPPVYRTTPLGREIVDMLVAVNRAYNKSDYIPVIAWGRNAKFCKDLKIGQNIIVNGRIQSRQYEKKFPDGTLQKRKAYEVSLNKLELITE